MVFEMEHKESEIGGTQSPLAWIGIHHIGVLCQDLEVSVKFYRDFLGFKVNDARPNQALWFRGAWFWVGPNMIHIMELFNPDPKEGRPEYGGEDRHVCLGIERLEPLIGKLEEAKIAFTRAVTGRRAIFFRDPDANTIEVFETKNWM